MTDLYDRAGKHVGYVGGGGDAGGCLQAVFGLFMIITAFKIAMPVWALLRSHNIHPVFILLLFAAIVAAAVFVIGWLLQYAKVRGVAAGLVSGVSGYFTFMWVMNAADFIWACAAGAIFAFFAYRFIRWAVEPYGDLSDVFFL